MEEEANYRIIINSCMEQGMMTQPAGYPNRAARDDGLALNNKTSMHKLASLASVATVHTSLTVSTSAIAITNAIASTK